MRKPSLVARRRMAPMPVLPVFFDVAGKTALIAGGGEEAAWKAELIAAAGANLRIAAGRPCAALKALARAEPERAILLRRRWRAEDFDGAVLAVGAFDDEAEAEEFASSARARGVPVNTVDKPQTCGFQFGAVVNRGPVVVSVSTGGAAPALGQSIRSRIESLLPESLAGWAEAAGRLRAVIAARIPDRLARAAFWRRFADAAFETAPPDIDAAIGRMIDANRKPAGKATIVGAGPGAAEHLTLQALRALRAADVILFDDLVSDEALDFARREARRIAVGKRGGRASCRQDDINALMLRLARQGKQVVRLKSGDPMIFGRAGEEIAALEAHGIDVEVVPGVTAALAAAAKLKTSLTHRDHAQGVKFITAHSRHGALPEIDWRAAADPAVTLMIYMGARMAPVFARRLIDEGLSPATPAVVATAVSRPRERFQRLRLADLLLTDLDPADPVLIGVGSVFGAGAAEKTGGEQESAESLRSLAASERP